MTREHRKSILMVVLALGYLTMGVLVGSWAGFALASTFALCFLAAALLVRPPKATSHNNDSAEHDWNEEDLDR